jgi:hypothetical protein
MDPLDQRRQEEIEGRLAEMEFAAEKLTRGSRSALYLRRELTLLLEEAHLQVERWSEVLARAQAVEGLLVGLLEDGTDSPDAEPS